MVQQCQHINKIRASVNLYNFLSDVTPLISSMHLLLTWSRNATHLIYSLSRVFFPDSTPFSVAVNGFSCGDGLRVGTVNGCGDGIRVQNGLHCKDVANGLNGGHATWGAGLGAAVGGAGDALTTSAVEHEDSVLIQLGYDALCYNVMLSNYHGSWCHVTNHRGSETSVSLNFTRQLQVPPHVLQRRCERTVFTWTVCILLIESSMHQFVCQQRSVELYCQRTHLLLKK